MALRPLSGPAYNGMNAAFVQLQPNAAEHKLIMKIGALPDACRTQWNRGFTASERTGSGVS